MNFPIYQGYFSTEFSICQDSILKRLHGFSEKFITQDPLFPANTEAGPRPSCPVSRNLSPVKAFLSDDRPSEYKRTLGKSAVTIGIFQTA